MTGWEELLGEGNDGVMLDHDARDNLRRNAWESGFMGHVPGFILAAASTVFAITDKVFGEDASIQDRNVLKIVSLVFFCLSLIFLMCKNFHKIEDIRLLHRVIRLNNDEAKDPWYKKKDTSGFHTGLAIGVTRPTWIVGILGFFIGFATLLIYLYGDKKVSTIIGELAPLLTSWVLSTWCSERLVMEELWLERFIRKNKWHLTDAYSSRKDCRNTCRTVFKPIYDSHCCNLTNNSAPAVKADPSKTKPDDGNKAIFSDISKWCDGLLKYLGCGSTENSASSVNNNPNQVADQDQAIEIIEDKGDDNTASADLSSSLSFASLKTK